MKKIVYFTFLSLLTTSLFAQNKTVDSLKAELKFAEEDTVKVKILNRLSGSFYPDNPNEVIKYGEAGLKLGEKLKWKKGIGDAHNNLGMSYWIRSDFPRAMKHYYTALKNYEEIDDKKGMEIIYNNLGIILSSQNNYIGALKYISKALDISKTLGEKKSTSVYLSNIGDIYLSKKEYRNALNYFNESLRLSTKLNDSNNIAFSLTNIGITYNNMKEYSRGLASIHKSIAIHKNNSSLFNGYNKFELGRAYYLMALEKPNNKNKEQLLKQSVHFFNESISCFKNIDALDDLQQSYSYIYKIAKEQGNYKKALNYFGKSATLKDSIFSQENKNKIQLLESQREIDLKDKQIQIQELQINSKERQVYLLISITIIVALLLTVFFLLFLSKRKTNRLLKEKNKKISEINAQKDLFFSIIAHDLRGPFNVFLGLTEFLADDIENMTQPEIQYSAVSMRDSATNLFRLLENLLEWSRMEQGLISFQPKNLQLQPIAEETISVLQESAKKKKIEIIDGIQEVTVLFSDKNMLQAIIRNLVSNAIKFTPKGGKINIAASIDIEKNVVIRVSDSGIGMDQKMIDHLFDLDVKTSRNGTENEPSSGLGLILCKDFIEKHDGKIRVESEEGKGTTIYFILPNEKKSKQLQLKKNGIANSKGKIRKKLKSV